MIQALINHGANVNFINLRNQTALTLVLVTKNESAINILLNAGADPNIAALHGNTSLLVAVRQECSREMIQALINNGADVNATNKGNETVLTLACVYKNEGSVNVLLNAHADPTIADDAYGDTSLHKAVRQTCSIKVIQAVTDHGANMNATKKECESASTLACIDQTEGALYVLLNAGADPNIAGYAYGDTSLHIADRKECSREVIQTVIDHGANVNAANKENETALTLACMNNNEDVINVLLNAGADPNVADDVHGDASLHKAVKKTCSQGMIQALINHGANVNARNKVNETALALDCMNKNEDAIKCTTKR